MTFFHFKAINPSLHTTFSNGNKSEFITLKLNLDDYVRLEIGDEYMLANKKTFERYGADKEEVESHLTIYKESVLLGSEIELRKRDKEMGVGFASFHPAYYSDITYESSSSKLYFSVYVSDEVFNRVYSAITAKLFITQIRLEAETRTNDEIEFNLGMDGAHQIWKFKGEHSKLDLYNFGISFSQAEEINCNEAMEKTELKNTLITKLFKDISSIQLSLYVIAAAAAIDIAKKIFG